MKTQAVLDKFYAPSTEVAARQIEEEFITIPVTSGVGNLEEEISSLNETAKAIWNKLDGEKSLRGIAKELENDFFGNLADIEKDCPGLANKLLKRKILVEKMEIRPACRRA